MRFSTGKYGFLKNPMCCLIAFSAALACIPGFANDGLTSDAIIQRAGLTVEWSTHTGVGASGNLVDWQIVVDENAPTTFFTIKAGKYEEKFSQNTLDAFGEPFGVEGAREHAAVRMDVLKAELSADGITDVEIKVLEYTLPETTVFVLTSNSVVQAIDGDTGKLKWSSQTGRPGLPSIGLGANASYVATVNGSDLHCLDAKNGSEIWNAKCQFAPSASPTVSGAKIYVPLLNGRVEEFELEKNGANPTALVSQGRVTARPLTTKKTVSWPNSRGVLSVAARYGRKRGVAYQLHADKPIVNLPAYKDGMFYVASLDGFVYALDEERGSVVWQVSTGRSISESPVIMGDFVFVMNDGNELFKIDTRTGWDAEGWEIPRKNIDRFLGAGKDKMYMLDQFGQLIVMSKDSGSVLSSVRIGNVAKILPNLESDRMYVVSDSGMIRCLREISSPIPHFHSNEYVVPVELDPSAANSKQGGGSDTTKPVDLDDPFGGGVKKPDDVVVPGSDANDPFGGVKPDPTNPDPNNPFGGVKPATDSGKAVNPKSGSNPPASGGLPEDDDPFK